LVSLPAVEKSVAWMWLKDLLLVQAIKEKGRMTIAKGGREGVK
jgi:hypothetical protein